MPRVLEPDALIAVLEQEVQLAEDLRDVPAIDLVYDQQVGRGRIRLRLVGDLAERAVDELEAQRSALLQLRSVPLEEVLVGVRRVELDQPVTAAVRLNVAAEVLRDIRLAAARRSIEDQLLLLLQHGEEPHQP